MVTRPRPGWGCGGGEASQVVSAAGFLGPAWPGLVAKEQSPLATRLQPWWGLRTHRKGWGRAAWEGEDAQASTAWPGVARPRC